MPKRAHVLADQAAGLRRRCARQPVRCIQCFFDSAESTAKLASELHQRGWALLLVDTRGGAFADFHAQSLFDWRQQIARGQLHTLPMGYGEGWYAPGIQGDEPALMTIAQRYDGILFNVGPKVYDCTPMPGADHTFIIEVSATHESMLHGYALLKTLFHLESRVSVGLLGDAVACDRLQQACKQFLDPSFSDAIYRVEQGVDAFAMLAVRMTGEETGL